MVSATVILDSVSPAGHRLTTFQVTMHRFVLAEFNTHRMLSRNFRSSRAVPTSKLLDEVRTNPAMPVHWGKNQPGMQAAAELDGVGREWSEAEWRAAAGAAAYHAERMLANGAHKQIANRLLEPFLYVHGVVTATEWQNFFGLRLHRDAQPEIRALAEAMWSAYCASAPWPLRPGEWHLPYIDVSDRADVEHFRARWAARQSDIDILTRVSTARCARVSNKVFDSNRRSAISEDLALYDKLVGAQPVHASPAEHQATPDENASVEQAIDSYGSDDATKLIGWQNPEQHGNFRGWRQNRKMLAGEAVAPLPAEFAA